MPKKKKKSTNPNIQIRTPTTHKNKHGKMCKIFYTETNKVLKENFCTYQKRKKEKQKLMLDARSIMRNSYRCLSCYKFWSTFLLVSLIYFFNSFHILKKSIISILLFIMHARAICLKILEIQYNAATGSLWGNFWQLPLQTCEASVLDLRLVIWCTGSLYDTTTVGDI